MESWRQVWREGIAPSLSTAGLQALSAGLQADDSRLVQGSTTTPPPLMTVADWPIEAACALGYCGWQAEGCKTVGEVEEYFARVCFDCDSRLKEPAACRWYLNWFDDTPRNEMRRELFIEVERELAVRGETPNKVAGVCARCKKDSDDIRDCVCANCGDDLRMDQQSDEAMREHEAAEARSEPVAVGDVSEFF